MITLTQVRVAVRAFETTTLPPLSDAWDKIRHEMHIAIQQYAEQEGLTVAQVSEMVE